MIISARHIANSTLAAIVAAFLSGCAGGAEFQGTPQEGASRTGAYPTFGRMPKAATDQITAEEKEQILTTLDSDRTRLAASRSSNGNVTASQAAETRRQAQEEIDATLRQIEADEE